MENKHEMTAVHFKFAPAALECRDALSAIVQIGDTLWVANDESIYLERLSYQGADAAAGRKRGEDGVLGDVFII